MITHLVSLLLGLYASTGSGVSLSLDSTQSHAEFAVRVLWLSQVTGEFPRGMKGTVRMDAEHRQAQVNAWIDASQVQMQNKRYQRWVRSAEFFDVAQYPRIHFQSVVFPLDRLVNGGDLRGHLTLRGVTRPVHFELLPSDCRHERQAIDCPVRAKGIIHRSSFGMTSHPVALSDRVELGLVIVVKPASHE